MGGPNDPRTREPLLHVPPAAQAGAIAYRRDESGGVQVLLIRRRHKRRWGIPKGDIDPGHSPAQTAAQESLEEAGVSGELSSEPIGSFEYVKMGRLHRVTVYLLHVTREHDLYPEAFFRERRWFTLDDAMKRKLRKGILPLLSAIR